MRRPIQPLHNNICQDAKRTSVIKSVAETAQCETDGGRLGKEKRGINTGRVKLAASG